MVGFKGDVTIKRLNTTTYELVGDLTYINDKLKVKAKHGMPTNGASVPRFMWRLIGSPFVGDYVCSAVIHDALYISQGLGLLTKEEADKLFLEMMEIEGVSLWKRNAMYYAVKWFGDEAWDSIEKDGGKYCEISFINSVS